jgi:Cu(I)/Ag(I) efflux system membrane fusion protein
MFARVTLAALPGDAVAVTVPAAAVLSDGEATSVVVSVGDGRFQRRVVECGPETDGRVRVLTGLRAGEGVVVDGALYLAAAIEGT